MEDTDSDAFPPFALAPQSVFCSGPPEGLNTPWLPTSAIKVYTLVFPITKDGRILLGMKKRGFGSHRYNGFGGKVEPGETVFEAAERELYEEAGITAKSMIPCGRIRFAFENSPVLMDVHVYRVEEWEGTEVETEEMRPEWHSYATKEDSAATARPLPPIPFDKMWPDDDLWFPLFLSFKTFVGRVDFNRPSTDGEEQKMEDGQMRKWYFAQVPPESVAT